ncbi:MAG: hypothetical protein AAF752_01850 [Bacteroidota bacterium]
MSLLSDAMRLAFARRHRLGWQAAGATALLAGGAAAASRTGSGLWAPGFDLWMGFEPWRGGWWILAGLAVVSGALLTWLGLWTLTRDPRRDVRGVGGLLLVVLVLGATAIALNVAWPALDLTLVHATSALFTLALAASLTAFASPAWIEQELQQAPAPETRTRISAMIGALAGLAFATLLAGAFVRVYPLDAEFARWAAIVLGLATVGLAPFAVLNAIQGYPERTGLAQFARPTLYLMFGVFIASAGLAFVPEDPGPTVRFAARVLPLLSAAAWFFLCLFAVWTLRTSDEPA